MQRALLWLFIDGNDTVSLRTLLATHEQQWSRSEEVHDALASSYQALSLPQTALDRYLTPRFKAHQGRLPVAHDYADAWTRTSRQTAPGVCGAICSRANGSRPARARGARADARPGPQRSG